MAEYIDRVAAMTIPVLPKEHREHHTFNLDDAYEQGWNDALENLKHIPAADVAPVRHGRWKEADDGDGIVCSLCGTDFCTLIYDTEYFNYCPNCGAKMDGDTDD